MLISKGNIRFVANCNQRTANQQKCYKSHEYDQFILMFLFECCKTCINVENGQGYELRKRGEQQDYQFVSSLKDIEPHQLYEDNFNIIKINKSDYYQLLNKLTSNYQAFTDQSFPPNQISLGNIQQKGPIRWKRISDFLRNPDLLGSGIYPYQITESTIENRYLLSGLATIAEQPDQIKRMFGNQNFNDAGIYKVTLQLHGRIQQIIIDDFIPVNKLDEPIFCKPYENVFWPLIVEKVWAKINGSYENIQKGVAADVLRAFTFAPSNMCLIKNRNEELWNMLSDYTAQSYPICCLSLVKDVTNGLFPQYFYTILLAIQLQDCEGVHHKIIKLRDRLDKSSWEGYANPNDHSFWSKIDSQNKMRIYNQNALENKGIFYMTFNDFCDHFKEIHSCLLNKNLNYFSQPLNYEKNNKKKGKVFELQILKQGEYSFSVHQGTKYEQNGKQKLMPQVCRTTILLISNNQGKLDFIDGKLKYNELNATLTKKIKPGSYLLFIKIDLTRTDKIMPKILTFSVYSTNYISLQPTLLSKYPDLLRKAFLGFARSHRTNIYHKGMMWVSSQLLFAQGGYGFIAFGNDEASNKKFIVDLSEEQFNIMNLKLKGQFKKIGTKTIQIMPGQQLIILARVRNQTISFLKFPPKIMIKTEYLSR